MSLAVVERTKIKVPPNVELTESAADQLKKCKEFLGSVEDVLKHNELAETLNHGLKTLGRFNATASSDFAPLSFGWSERRNDGGQPYVGGLIFHGPHDNGGDGGAPTFSVNVSAVHGWAIHT